MKRLRSGKKKGNLVMNMFQGREVWDPNQEVKDQIRVKSNNLLKN